MDWLRRIGRSPPAPAGNARDAPALEPVERPTPGVAALFDGIDEDRSHAVLDLGPASDSSLRVYSRFARWVRFADLLAATARPAGLAAALGNLPPQTDRPYDLVFAWDILDRLEADERPKLIERLTEVTAPDARLYIVVDASPNPTSHPHHFALLDTDRMRYERSENPRAVHSPLLPAEVERILEPFHVKRAFTSQTGLREYLALRR